jgi:hypothetical protein
MNNLEDYHHAKINTKEGNTNNEENKLKEKLQNLIDDYRYKIYDLGRDLNNMDDRERIIRCALEKTVSDLEELLKCQQD